MVHLLILLASINVSDEPWIPKLISHKISGREERFCHEVRNRDRKCVISRTSIPEIHIQANNWTTFEAAHIFPLRHGSLWVQDDHGQWMTDMHDATGSSRINSIKNEFLLRMEVHKMIDQYLISVNPDDGYKIVVFDPDLYGSDGRILDPVCRNLDDPHCVSEELLRWHFRQSVLANIRGAGEPIIEYDIPSGTDMEGEVLAGPYAQGGSDLEIPAGLAQVL